MVPLPDDGRATNPSSTQEAIAQVRHRFPTVKNNTSPLRFIVGSFHCSNLHFFAFYRDLSYSDRRKLREQVRVRELPL